MHVEEVDKDRQRNDDSKRHMEGGQRQACTWKRWTETDRGRMTVRYIRRVDRDRHARGRVGQRKACTWKRWTETDRGRMTCRDIWRVERHRHVEEVDRDRQRKDDRQRHMEGGQRQA
jgi:hypothetical protein